MRAYLPSTLEECRTFADKVPDTIDMGLLIIPMSEWNRPDGPFADTQSTMPALTRLPNATRIDPNNPLEYVREVEGSHALQLFIAALKEAQKGGTDRLPTLIARAFSGCGPDALERRLEAIKPAMLEAFSQSGPNSNDCAAWWENSY